MPAQHPSNAFKTLWQFVAVFLIIFFSFCVFLFAIDFVPEKPQGEKATNEEAGPSFIVSDTYPIEAPTRLVAAKVGIDTAIENPLATDISSLDDALLKGAVRYPESGLLGENAAMFIFAHQSYLPVVRNQAFKAFNGLQDLAEGDEIRVFSEQAVYVYHVRSVALAEAEDTLVTLEKGSRTLTLSTCNSFGEKSERYVVAADFVSREPLETSL